MKRLVVGALLVATTAAADQPPREAARYILEKHCGACHRQDSPDALPAALRIFNLNQIDFAATMSDAQLSSARGRIEHQGVAARDVATFVAWVQEELAHRRAARGRQ
jgi:hypothetical protein